MNPADYNSEESQQIQALMEQFFKSYYTRRDPQWVISHADENIIFTGLSPQEICSSRRDFIHLVTQQTQQIPSPISYRVMDLRQSCAAPGLWTCFSIIALQVSSGDWGLVRYRIRLTFTFRRDGSDWQILSIHTSEASAYDTADESVSYCIGEDASAEDFPQQKLSQLLNHVIPGAVLSHRLAEGWPITLANTQFLRMTGFDGFPAFREAQQGLFSNALHPKDEEKYHYAVDFMAATGKQYECEFRLLTKENTYLWVHMMGKKVSSPEGEEFIFCVMMDMSQQIERRHQLEMENGLDFLTKIYNRKGAMDAFRKSGYEAAPYLLLILDLDNFKLVNDLYGHVQGDYILKFTADLLTEAFGQAGIVSRLGGDEFMVVLPGNPHMKAIESSLRHMLKAYREHLAASCPKARSSLSAGGIYGAKKYTMDEKYRLADQNLYLVKNSEKGTFLITSCDT